MIRRVYTNLKNINNMKHKTKENYLAPEIEVFEVCVEQGFAQSNGDPISDFIPSFGEEKQW